MNADPASSSGRKTRIPWLILGICVSLVTGSALLCLRLTDHGALANSHTRTIGLGQAELSLASGGDVPTERPNAAPEFPDRQGEATAYSRDLVSAIARLDNANHPLTREQAEQWKKELDSLIQQGPDGAKAIAEFLQTNTDVIFGRAGRELIGFNSAREALFDALLRIGGPEAVSATLNALRNSADPREIALLAQNLDKLAPDVYRQDALNAAREVLSMAENGKLTDFDVAPLFEVLSNYGGPDVVQDLEHASRQWEFYSAIALANLPDGVGIPSLVQMARQDGPAQTTALQLLAQLSADYAPAGAALAAQLQANKIPQQTWPFLVQALAGNEYFFQNTGFAGPEGRAHPGNVSTAHVSSGNQTFYNAFNPGSLTQGEINQRIAFIDQLRAVATQPAARNALQEAVDLLMKRLPSTAATP